MQGCRKDSHVLNVSGFLCWGRMENTGRFVKDRIRPFQDFGIERSIPEEIWVSICRLSDVFKEGVVGDVSKRIPFPKSAAICR